MADRNIDTDKKFLFSENETQDIEFLKSIGMPRKDSEDEEILYPCSYENEDKGVPSSRSFQLMLFSFPNLIRWP